MTGVSDLVGELSTRSDDFRPLGRPQRPLSCATVKHLHHPLVGDLTLTYEALHLPNDAGQRILVYATEPRTAYPHSTLLASWAAQPAKRQLSRQTPTRA